MESAVTFIKYEGKLVEDGFLDARKTASALSGIDEALRFFLYHENPDLELIPFEIPVRIRKGSWEAIFPENLDELLLKGLAAWSIGKYAGSALEEMAKNDFKDFGFKDIFRNAFKAMTWVIKAATHLGALSRKNFRNISFSPDNRFIGLKNDYDRILWFPVEFLEHFSNCPESLFQKIIGIVEEDREFVIGYIEPLEQEQARVNYKNRYIFLNEEEDKEVLFPELEHGAYVELEGHITRGNEKTNTLGLLYQNHVLTCLPQKGNIKDYKTALFNNCVIKGYIDRQDKQGTFIEKRPRIKFISISIIDSRGQLSLF
ncbi:hypothetical protein EFA69_03585 [Rufibacter immobilis]|uniref:Uncharacterized protein n=1 Tax=Rufibacter immobilis TaxID=1348778 RepID=A0A3M9N521_9BACT|nr:hypothetical protein [Rufibacter immobilis]RNI32417.1 hypothetical protein EFA69_03585 [Rufibacter immobilis]